MHGLHPFLAVTHRVASKILVVDGWMPTYVVEQVSAEFETGNYEMILIARGLQSGTNPYESGEFTANYIVEQLAKLGISKNCIRVIFFEVSIKDRTYHAALAVKKYLVEQQKEAKALNLATLSAHARRSRILYEKAFFSEEMEVGVIALEDEAYDPAHWWRSSAGVREVPFEFLACIYAKFFFSPD